MIKLLTLLALCLLTACKFSVDTPDVPTGTGRVVGAIEMDGCTNKCGVITVIEVEGTKCIVVGRYSAVAMSCNWKEQQP